LTLVSLLLLWFTEAQVWLGVAVVLLVLVMAWPRAFAPVTPVWFKGAELIGRIVSTLLLTLLYYLIVTPVGLVRRMLRADPLQLRAWHGNAPTAFRERMHTYSAKDLEPPY